MSERAYKEGRYNVQTNAIDVAWSSLYGPTFFSVCLLSTLVLHTFREFHGKREQKNDGRSGPVFLKVKGLNFVRQQQQNNLWKEYRIGLSYFKKQILAHRNNVLQNIRPESRSLISQPFLLHHRSLSKMSEKLLKIANQMHPPHKQHTYIHTQTLCRLRSEVGGVAGWCFCLDWRH